MRAVSFQLLGAQLAPSAIDSQQFFEAFDCAIDVDDGTVVLFGLRTVSYLSGMPRLEVERWAGGYTPLAVTLDLGTVRHWDFNKSLWLGPSPHPCLMWSNAHGVSIKGIQYLLDPERNGSILQGEDGTGLPRPEQLGIHVPAGLERHTIEPGLSLHLR